MLLTGVHRLVRLGTIVGRAGITSVHRPSRNGGLERVTGRLVLGGITSRDGWMVERRVRKVSLGEGEVLVERGRDRNRLGESDR